MEFVQFHPTALRAGGRAFLISEAVRGEGAWLVDGDGHRFMADVHPDAELAPRDVVTRAIEALIASGDGAYLTLAHLDRDRVLARFPNLAAGCARAGLDLSSDRIPVAPAAHYLMGGIATDLDGATTIAGLYAGGECAATGVHGANRLASNSLLECFVFSHRAVDCGLRAAAASAEDGAPPERPHQRAPLPELRRRMWDGAGPVRDEDGLLALSAWIGDAAALKPHARRRAHRHERASPHREPRRPPAQRLSRPRSGPGQEQRVPTASLDGVIDRALAEDAGRGDPTTEAIVPDGLKAIGGRRAARARRRVRPRRRT